ncbi:MAG: hypothetical protein KTV77_04745 [Wolbachia endosymbiont of Fragariocoptes setiger]|nr:hypothetical protein [Wolbachia endosymbiont of Fragariocoptes setiger]
MFNSISEELYNHRGYFSDALKAELGYKAFLDGILTGLSDIRSGDLKVIVPIEFQVGRGKRVDVAIQTIGKNGKQGIPILIELKTNPSGKEFSLAQKQLAQYLESPNIKSITDGKQATGFVAALNTKGKSVETMIRISDKLAVATIQHSSIIAPSSSHRAQKYVSKVLLQEEKEKSLVAIVY